MDSLPLSATWENLKKMFLSLAFSFNLKKLFLIKKALSFNFSTLLPIFFFFFHKPFHNSLRVCSLCDHFIY